MTKSDITDHLDDKIDRFGFAKRAVVGTLGGIVLVFLAGVAAGFTRVVMDHGGPSAIDVAILAAIALTGAAVVWGLWRFLKKTDFGPEAPSVKRSRRLLYVMMGVGLVLGIVLGVGSDGDIDGILNGPIDKVVVLAAIAVWLVAVPYGTWLWWKSVDEHEAGAYRDGGLIAIHAYIFLAPTWWLATRAGLAPPQDPMLVLLLVSAVWGAAWFVRQYF
jgi:hypothetical protein